VFLVAWVKNTWREILIVLRSVLEASTLNNPSQDNFMRGALWDLLYSIGRTMKLCVTVQRSVAFGSIASAQSRAVYLKARGERALDYSSWSVGAGVSWARRLAS
jgi:hypothetical protein